TRPARGARRRVELERRTLASPPRRRRCSGGFQTMELRSSPVSSIRMSRFAFMALALAVAVLGLVATGCGKDSHRAATSAASTPRPAASCKLNKGQRHAVALALADIRRLRSIEASVQTFSQRGAPGENELTGKVMVDLGSANLPLNTFGHLLHLAKA